MSSQASHTSKNDTINVNGSIDSAFRNDPSHRGSLTQLELDSIHQSNSFKQALKLQKQDNRDILARQKSVEQKSSTS